MNGLAPEDHGNAYVTWERQAGALIINTDVLKKHKLSEPKTYEDLLDRKYYNLIAMPDPKSSGTGYFFFKNLVNTMGEEKALAYIDKLEFNVKQFTESGSGQVYFPPFLFFTSVLAASITSGRSIVLTDASAITLAAVRSPLWAIGLHD